MRVYANAAHVGGVSLCEYPQHMQRLLPMSVSTRPNPSHLLPETDFPAHSQVREGRLSGVSVIMYDGNGPGSLKVEGFISKER
jgi:hypothetical protein